jgi:hypothetical protein
MCCDSGGDTNVPQAQETEFSKTLAQIMRERQDSAAKYEPLENQLIGRANEFSSPQFEAQQAGKAMATSDASFDASKQQSDAELSSMGVNPNSGRFADRNRGLMLGRSLGRTAAGNTTRDNVRRLGFDSLAGIAGRGDAKVGQAISAAGTGGGLMNQSQSNQISWQNAQQSRSSDAMGGIGSLVGMGLSIFSSRKLKRNVKPPGDARAQLDAMPAKRWRYLDGVADGGAQEHTGPMAEDVQAATGGQASDGTKVSIPDLLGTTVAAVQDLSKSVRKLEQRK